MAAADRTLAPGAYQDVTVAPTGALRLQTGTYFLRSLRVSPNVVVTADTQAGPIFIYASEALDLKSPIVSAGLPSNLFVGYLGDGEASIVAPFRGTVVAPNGALRLGAGGAEMRGSFFGKNIRVDANVTFRFEAFSSWEFLLPPVPVLDCVVHFDGTHSNALWGYENPSDVAVTIPVGPRNLLTPADSRVVTTFEPGRHEKVFFGFFGTPQASWRIGDKPAVVADTNTSTRCGVGALPPPGPADDLPRSESASAPQAALVPLMQTRTVGTSSGTLGFTTLPPTAATDRFRFIIDDQYLSGNDAVCGPRQLSVNVFLDGIGEIRNLPGCTNPYACGVPAVSETYEKQIARGQTEVAIGIEVSERDDPLCGDDDDHILTANLVASAQTGAILRGSLVTYRSDGSVNATIFLDPGVSSVRGLDDFGIHFSTAIVPPPQICAAWRTQYVDSGPKPGFPGSEDYVKTLDPEDVAASFSRAELLVRSGGVTRFEWSGVLDKLGCIPRAQTPGADLLNATPDLLIRLTLQSEACWDPAGGDCTAPTPDGGTTGARMRVKVAPVLSRSDALAAGTTQQMRCAFLTRDAAAIEPSCDGVRDLPGWTAEGRAPLKILLVNPSIDPLAQAMALVSHVLRLEDDGAELGVRAALLPSGRQGSTRAFAVPGLIEIALNTVVCFGDSPGVPMCANGEQLLTCLRRGACDTASSDPIAFAPARIGNFGETLFSETAWKYSMAHELGHKLQERAMGRMFGTYSGNPGIRVPDRCACDHVTSANALHCLQSIEEPGAAQAEGWAQFFASRVWNSASEDNCVFKYYKEFLNEGCMPGVPLSECKTLATGVSSKPPISIDCLAPVRWRNNVCFDATVAPTEAVTEFGVEYDWMGFLYSVNTQGADRASMDDLFGIHRAACGGPCGGKGQLLRPRLTWDACTGTGCAPGVAGLSGGADRFFGDAARLENALRFIRAGDDYGVSRSVRR